MGKRVYRIKEHFSLRAARRVVERLARIGVGRWAAQNAQVHAYANCQEQGFAIVAMVYVAEKADLACPRCREGSLLVERRAVFISQHRTADDIQVIVDSRPSSEPFPSGDGWAGARCFPPGAEGVAATHIAEVLRAWGRESVAAGRLLGKAVP